MYIFRQLWEVSSIQVGLFKFGMGVCTSSQDRRIQHLSPPIDAIPPETEFLKSAKLPVLAFYVLISNIKLKRCPHDHIALRFMIENVDTLITPLQQPDRQGRVYWKIEHAFDFYMTDYELRNHFLVVEAVSGKGEVVGGLKMNLFLLWTGPYHIDFGLETTKPANCRISFNFKISQGIHINLTNLSTQMLSSQEPLQGERFAYSIEAIVQKQQAQIGQQLQQARCPYVVRVRGKEEKLEEQERNGDFFVEKKNIRWLQRQGEPVPMPSFDKKIAYYQIYASSLHLIFFKIVPSPSTTDPSYELLSQCFISLRKLMTIDFLQHKQPSSNITYLQRNVSLQEKTWLHGKQIGKAKVRFKFIMQAHLKQMQICVRTEDGILASSPLFSEVTGQCEEIATLGRLSREVQREFINMVECYEHYNLITVRESVLRINSLLTQQLALLERSSKQSIIVYEYKNEMELVKAQGFLINMAFKATTYIREDKADISEVSWSILTAILKRGQFKLSYIGFSKEERELLAKGKGSDRLKKKVEVALKYEELLNQLLKQTFTLLASKGDEPQRIFAESFCAYAYFRMPAFRQLILSAVSRQDDPQIPEWRGTQVDLYESGKMLEQEEEYYDLHFDWENNFYQSIAPEDQHQHHQEELKAILQDDKWKERLAKRRGAFHTFLQNLVGEIEYVSVVSKYIRWHCLPGYNRLLRAFLVELKGIKVTDYGERIKRTSLKLLANEKLLNVFVVVLLQKTNLNDSNAVSVTLAMISSFLLVLNACQRPIPSTFDYLFFLQGLKLVLNSDLQLCICEALLLVYNNLFNFSQQFGLQLCLYLLSGLFFKFFFHWSYNLRMVFHTLLFARVGRFSEERLSSNPQKHNVDDVYTMTLKLLLKQRMKLLMEVIKREVEPFPTSSADMLTEKELFKKMRYKLSLRKEQRQKNCSLQIIEDLTLPNLRGVKSVSNGGTMVPSNWLYFRESEMVIVAPKQELRYLREAFSEYNCMAQKILNSLKQDPTFVPQIKLRRIADENELGLANADEW